MLEGGCTKESGDRRGLCGGTMGREGARSLIGRGVGSRSMCSRAASDGGAVAQED